MGATVSASSASAAAAQASFGRGDTAHAAAAAGTSGALDATDTDAGGSPASAQPFSNALSAAQNESDRGSAHSADRDGERSADAPGRGRDTDTATKEASGAGAVLPAAALLSAAGVLTASAVPAADEPNADDGETAAADTGAKALAAAAAGSVAGAGSLTATSSVTGEEDGAADTAGAARPGKRTTASKAQTSSDLSVLALLWGAPASSTLASAAAAALVAAGTPRGMPASDTGRDASAGSRASNGGLMGADTRALLALAAPVTSASFAGSGPSAAAVFGNAADSGGGGASADAGTGSVAGSPASALPAMLHLTQSLADGAGAIVSPALASRTLNVPVADPSWPDALAAQVQWMVNHQVQSATLRLSPEHLGPLEVRIDVAHSQVNVSFSAHHPDTRDALAQAVPRLRELFSSSGLSLGQATVQQDPRSSGQSGPAIAPDPASDSETVEPVANTSLQRLGLIDEYV